MQNTPHKVGDQFLNPLTQKTNTVTHIEQNHYYSGDKTHGPYYTLNIEGLNREINLTPIMISRFTKL